MAVALKHERLYTPDEYLALEETAEGKSEYYKGEIFAMSGGSANHNRIVSSINAFFHSGLRGRRCESFTSDMRVQVKAHGLFTYPDAMIICGQPEFWNNRNDTVTNPILIVEVLSESTKDYDRGQKFEFYRTIPTLRDYVLIHQDRVHIEYYHKLEDGRWLLTEIGDPEALLILETVDLTLPVRSIYERVDWLAA